MVWAVTSGVPFVMSSMIRVCSRIGLSTAVPQCGQVFSRCSHVLSMRCGGGRHAPAWPGVRPGLLQRRFALGFKYTGVMPEGVVGATLVSLELAWSCSQRSALFHRAP